MYLDPIGGPMYFPLSFSLLVFLTLDFSFFFHLTNVLAATPRQLMSRMRIAIIRLLR